MLTDRSTGRQGRQGRTDASPLHDKHGEIGDLVADRIDGDRPTDLVVHTVNDDEQSGSILLAASRHGLNRTGRKLREGNAIAFGDFDGDGRRDVAVGDSGTRNTEPGDETEQPEIGPDGERLRQGRGAPDGSFPYRFRILNMSGTLAAADTDGDGTDELAVSLGPGGVELLTLRLTPSPGRIAHRHTLTRTARPASTARRSATANAPPGSTAPGTSTTTARTRSCSPGAAAWPSPCTVNGPSGGGSPTAPRTGSPSAASPSRRTTERD